MARSEDEGVVLELLIVGLVEISSGALVHVAATAVEDVVGLGHMLCLFFRQRGRLQLLITLIWQPWRIYSSEDRFDGLRC